MMVCLPAMLQHSTYNSAEFELLHKLQPASIYQCSVQLLETGFPLTAVCQCSVLLLRQSPP